MVDEFWIASVHSIALIPPPSPLAVLACTVTLATASSHICVERLPLAKTPPPPPLPAYRARGASSERPQVLEQQHCARTVFLNNTDDNNETTLEE